MSKKLLFKGGHSTAMTPYEIEDFSSLHLRDPRIDEKTKAYIDSVIGNSVLNLCPYRNVLVTHKYDTVEGNVVTLDDCQDDEIIQLSEIQGNTMVNCNKDTDKELILMPNLDTNGYSNVTLTEGIDGGKVDVALEGNTMVNVCDQEEPVAITKSYTVETGNHIALQGEYDGKCRPNIYGNTLVNLMTKYKDEILIEYFYPVQNEDVANVEMLKPNTEYTLIYTARYQKTGDNGCLRIHLTSSKDDSLSTDQELTTSYTQYIYKFTTPSNVSNFVLRANSSYFYIKECILLEGDYTNKPIPDYFTGMKSSFEDKLITDENDANNGKYKVDYKVTGKNKVVYSGSNPKNGINTGYNSGLEATVESDYSASIKGTNTRETDIYFIGMWNNPQIRVKGGTYTISANCNGLNVGTFYIIEKGTSAITSLQAGSNVKTTITTEGLTSVMLRLPAGTYDFNIKLQIEEGTTATDYEPYKESIKTLYLNSPLLEGDTIEQSGNNIIHNHRYKEVVLDGSDDENWTINKKLTEYNSTQFVWSTTLHCINVNGRASVLSDKIPSVTDDVNSDNIWVYDGNTMVIHKNLNTLNEFKSWLQQNPITVVYELATPTQEIISNNDNLLLDSYTNGHLDVDTVVPIDKVAFKNVGNYLKYLYPSTEYTIQFESDNVGKIDYIYMTNKTVTENIDIIKGINKINITTNTSFTSNWFTIIGIGFNASKIVVTPKVDNNFGYFKGMKSVGECEGNKIEILSSKYKANHLSNSQCVYFSPNNTGLGLSTLMTDESEKYYRAIADEDRNVSLYGRPSHDYSYGEEYIYSMMIRTQKDTRVTIYENNHPDETRNTISVKANEWTTISTKPTKLFNLNALLLIADQVNCYVDYKNIKLEKGKTITPWMPSKNDNEYNSWRFLNKKEILLNEPLRGLPNGVRDKYTMIDGKWYIERNTVDIYIKNFNKCVISTFTEDSSLVYVEILDYDDIIADNAGQCLCENFAYNGDFNRTILVPAYSICTTYSTNKLRFAIPSNKLTDITSQSILEYFKNNPVNVICARKQPTYEPIDYNPFGVYTDTTHISNNSLIPCNMVIKNTGFNCILKPNTTYTVSSSNGLSTVTTKNSIGDSVLRFYDKDTTSITKMNKVLVLEGDYITGNPPIPAFFKGMESAFEQELVTDENDEHHGKYKVTVKAIGKNLFNKDTVIKGKYQNCNTNTNDFTIANHPNYSISDFVPVKPNTQYTISGTDVKYHAYYDRNKEPITTTGTTNTSFTTLSDVYYMIFNLNSTDDLSKIQIEQGTKATEYEPYKENNITFYINEPLRGVGDIKDKVYVKEDKIVVERNCSSITLNGSDNEGSWYMQGTAHYQIAAPYNIHLKQNLGGICNKFPVGFGNEQLYIYPILQGDTSYIRLQNGVTRWKTLEQFKQWLQINPVTLIYPLATPTYEEVEYFDLSKLALEGYNHGTLFYNSNIPVATQFYDFNVNIKDMLIPNETYYITFIADRVKDITINLSGVQVNYKTSMGYNKVPVQLGDVVNTNFSMDSRGVELSDLMISTSTSLIYVKDMDDVCIYDEATNKYSITITSTNGNESDKRVILLDYPLLRLNKDIYDRLYYNNKDSRYRIDKKVFKHKFTNDREYSKYAAETNDTYYSSFISLNETIKDYVVITNEKVKTVKVEDDKYYFKIKWSDLGVSDKTETNGNQGMKDFFNNNEVYLYYATDGFVEVVDGLRRQTLKMYQPETTINFLGNTTTTVTIIIPKKNI